MLQVSNKRGRGVIPAAAVPGVVKSAVRAAGSHSLRARSLGNCGSRGAGARRTMTFRVLWFESPANWCCDARRGRSDACGAVDGGSRAALRDLADRCIWRAVVPVRVV